MFSNNQINFQVSLKNKFDKSANENSSLEVRQAIQSICGIFHNKQLIASTTFAIRYLKEGKSNASPVKTFFSVSRTSEFSTQEIDLITAILDSKLGKKFRIFSCQVDWQNAISTNAISQIIKDEFFDLPNNMYAPKFLTSARSTNFQELIEFMERQGSNITLEICLKPYHAPDERVRWKQAINQMIQAIKSDESFKHLLIDYENYEKLYCNRDPILPVLFNYSIKAYGDNQGYVHALLNNFRDNAISSDRTTDCLVINLNSQSNSLVKVGQTGAIQRPEWQNNSLVNTPIKKIVKASKKEGWEALVDSENSSLNIDNWLASGIGLQNLTSTSNSVQALQQGGDQSSYGQLAPSQCSPIAKNQPHAAITIADLKPLHQIVCLEEVQGFLNLGVSKKMLYPTLTAEAIFNTYRHLITRDKYIVGLDDEGNPITSSWDEVPHRLLAGVPGAGKTNFLRWLLFQFLYVNPKRKVYITDFKGLDFQFLEELSTYANISITIEGCQTQVATIQNEEFLTRQQLMLKHKVTKLSALGKELQKHNEEEVDRTLWLIDEAADISFASSKVRTEIENSLTKYARQGRSYGIQVVYCTQRVSAAVITPQVSDQCEEKVIFRVGSAASAIVLDDSMASEIPMDAKGRAVLDSPNGRFFVNTPFMQSPEGSEIPISATLWKHIQHQ